MKRKAVAELDEAGVVGTTTRPRLDAGLGSSSSFERALLHDSSMARSLLEFLEFDDVAALYGSCRFWRDRLKSGPFCLLVESSDSSCTPERLTAIAGSVWARDYLGTVRIDEEPEDEEDYDRISSQDDDSSGSDDESKKDSDVDADSTTEGGLKATRGFRRICHTLALFPHLTSLDLSVAPNRFDATAFRALLTEVGPRLIKFALTIACDQQDEDDPSEWRHKLPHEIFSVLHLLPELTDLSVSIATYRGPSMRQVDAVDFAPLTKLRKLRSFTLDCFAHRLNASQVRSLAHSSVERLSVGSWSVHPSIRPEAVEVIEQQLADGLDLLLAERATQTDPAPIRFIDLTRTAMSPRIEEALAKMPHLEPRQQQSD